MFNRTLCALGVGGLLLCAGAPAESSPPGAGIQETPAQLRDAFLRANPGAALSERAGLVHRVYGRAFAGGDTALEAAESFRRDHAGMFGAVAGELVPAGVMAGGQPIMLQPDGTYKFTGYSYGQQRQGVPVFRGELKVLVRNEPGHPVVLASASLRNLGGFQVAAMPAAVDAALRRAEVVAIDDGPAEALATRKVIFAGVEEEQVEPRLADETLVGVGFDRWLIVTDSATGEVLFEEHKIHIVDIVGTAEGNATEGPGADICEAESPMGLPYLQVTNGITNVFTDANGDFLIPNAGSGSIQVSGTLANGQWFDVFDTSTAVESVSVTITPPGPANLLFNAANTSELIRAQVNAYLQANVIRDWTLSYNPAYPVIANQQNFDVVVNQVGGICPGNAWYDGFAINFCRAGSGFPNTAWSSVVYHEYGHHLVEVGGSGQGAYGEGMGDVVSVLILDDPRLGVGFFGNCNQSLRNADNNCQYSQASCSSCGSESHACGNLISGCVWSTRDNLVVTEPADYLDIISNLAVNSILMHSGSSITPDITVDYLTLDDDDSNILNGTPHYAEINGGFSDHGMPGPEIALLDFDFPSGLPDLLTPAGGTSVPVNVLGVTETPQPGTGKLWVDTGLGFTEVPMTEGAPNEYTAVFPRSDCGDLVSFYFSAETTGGDTATWPIDAPLSVLEAISGTGLSAAFTDDFETDMGWSVTNSGGLTDGQWQRATPIPNSTCDRGNPGSDADGSGMCYVTDNSSANGCNSDVDGGSTTLTSPVLDASGGEAYVAYWRWYDNTFGNAPFADIFEVEVSDDGGASWTDLETVGPAGPEVSGGWFSKSFRIADFVTANDQFRIRFTASDLGDGSVVEAGVDGVEIILVDCDADLVGDIDGDGVVGILDFLILLGDWGPCPDPCPPSCASDLDGDCVVGILDFLLLLANWNSHSPLAIRH